MSKYSIPKYNDLFIPVLNHIKATPNCHWKTLESPLGLALNLSEEDLEIPYESGNGKVFLDRISWSLSYLYKSGLVNRPKRGHYEITPLGLEYLVKPNEIKQFIKTAVLDSEKPTKEIKQNTIGIVDSPSDDQTPDERLNNEFQKIKQTRCDEIIEAILKKSPYAFEELVVQLLDKMGYGGKVVDAGSVTSKSNDGGIDGIIKEDILGLGRIHLQAKRYQLNSGIGREDIQKFVGALAVAQSNKGVFITTSYFTKGAIEYVKNLNGSTTIVLMDGQQLANYIYDYDLGMDTIKTITVKTLDSDFWE